MTHLLRRAGRVLALTPLVAASVAVEGGPVLAGPDPASPPPGHGLLTMSRLLAVDAAAEDDAWAVGDVRTAGIASTLIEHWNGTAWVQVASPNPGGEYGTTLSGVVAIAADNAWAVGSYGSATTGRRTLVLHWDGSKWRRVASPNPSPSGDNELHAVTAVRGRDVWAIGSATSHDLPSATLAMHWDGSSWLMAPSPNPSKHIANALYGVDAVSSRDVWAVGAFASSLTTEATLTAHWNGKRWARPLSPSPGVLGNQLLAVSAAKSKLVWAVGDTTTVPAQPQPLVELWNGRQWKVAPGPDLGGASASLTGVSAQSATNAWAVGYVIRDGFAHTLTVHWDGSAWTAVPSPSPGLLGNTLADVLTVDADDAWAVGFAVNTDLDGDRLITAWDGSAWALY